MLNAHFSTQFVSFGGQMYFNLFKHQNKKCIKYTKNAVKHILNDFLSVFIDV